VGRAAPGNLCREVSAAAAGARTEREFFARLAGAGVAVRKRYSTTTPDQVTGYAVGLPRHTAKGGGVIWYGGGKLAADLTLPKLRRRWRAPGADDGAFPGRGLSAAAARAVLRNAVTGAAGQAQDEAGFFARLREVGVLVRVRFSETSPGQVTGYSVSLPGHGGSDGQPLWYGGGRLSADLTLSRLRRCWDPSRGSAAESPGAFRLTAPERAAIYAHAARQAATASEHVRRCAEGDPAQAADAAWAAADALHVAARALRNPELRRAADSYSRAARARYGQIPAATREGNQLRAAARLMALAGRTTGDTTLVTMALIANLVALAIAVAELREAQQHAAQAAAARTAVTHLHAAASQARQPVRQPRQAETRRSDRRPSAADLARSDFPMPAQPGHPAADLGLARPSPRSGAAPSRRSGPGR
jgi:hypothetical protein